MNIPKVILDAKDYRRSVVGQHAEVHEVEVEDVLPDLVDLDLSEEHKTVKERTNYALLQLYEQKGYDIFKKTILNMKGNKWFKATDYGTFKGECAEIYLYATVMEFVKKFDLSWRVFLSLVIPHRDGIAGHTTELDLVLVSEEMITVFESKSYGGDKKITDVCSIKRSSGKTDIYGQNALHCESLIKQIADFNINDQKGMKSVLFSYAEGSLEDVRDTQYKRLMPVITEDNLLSYLTSLTKLEDKFWRDGVYKCLDNLADKYTMQDHMNHINRKK